MKIYIVGSGGVGGYFGGCLAKAGNDVIFVARGEHYKAIKANGLKVNSVIGNFIIKPCQVVNKISLIKNPELIIFTVKTYDTLEVAKSLAPVVNKNTVIITFQNGIDNDLQIKKIIKNTSVYPGVAYVISTRSKLGVISQTGGLRRLVIGDRNNPVNPILQKIETILKNSKIDAIMSDDITKDLWKKFIFINAFSGMTAICRCNIGKVLNDPVTLACYKRCINEVIGVAKLLKINLPKGIFNLTMATSQNTAPASKSSLLIDIENKRSNEIETLNGTIVKLAKEKGIEAPISNLIYGAIKLLNP